MRDNLWGASWRLTIFLVVCALGFFTLLAIFAQFRFQAEKSYRAEFTDASGLLNGDFVRIGGVEVGKSRRSRSRKTPRHWSSSPPMTPSYSPRAPRPSSDTAISSAVATWRWKRGREVPRN